MWLKHNAGLTQIELAMIFRKPKFEIVQILAAVVEQLKNKPLIVEKTGRKSLHWTAIKATRKFRDKKNKVRRKLFKFKRNWEHLSKAIRNTNIYNE